MVLLEIEIFKATGMRGKELRDLVSENHAYCLTRDGLFELVMNRVAPGWNEGRGEKIL